MTGRADRWIRWTTIDCVALLALIAGTVSCLHMHMLVARHGQPGWVAALTPLPVDGMIVAASTTLLADHRSGAFYVATNWTFRLALCVSCPPTALVARRTSSQMRMRARDLAGRPSDFSVHARMTRIELSGPGLGTRQSQRHT